MKKIYVTRIIPEVGITMLRDRGFEVDVNETPGLLSKADLLTALKAKEYDAVLSLLTDQIDGEVYDAAPTVKIYANYAVGFNNFDLEGAKQRSITLTNTPGTLTESVSEHAMALILALACRIVEADTFTRQGKYAGWEPLLFLGTDLKGKTIAIVGGGRIGERVAHHAYRGFGMRVIYYDIRKNDFMEKECAALFYDTVDAVLKEADFVSLHVPLLDSTKHLINKERLAMMKKTAFIINTSRGPVIDEVALVEALKTGQIRGAGLDVFENEPALAPGLAELSNVVLTPHIASATEETRNEMSRIAAQNIIDFLEGKVPENIVK